MSDTHHTPANFRTPSDDLIPRWLQRVILGLCLTVLALVSFAKITDRPLEAVPANTPVLSEVHVVLAAQSDGATQIYAPGGDLLVDLPSTKAGFVSGIVRVLERQRGLSKIAMSEPVALQLRDGGRITLVDPSTGWSVELKSYGANNTRAFATLLGVPTPAEGSH